MSRRKKKKSPAGQTASAARPAPAHPILGPRAAHGAPPQVLRLAFDDQTPPAAWPSVSLCMIVKNEEEHLPGCLASVADFPSEIIVVDTGSGDRTAEIARSCGAQVKHFAWANDFAAARNESIREATGEWIFWMDADDRIAPNELIRLKHAVASGQADGYFCNVASRLEETGQATETVEHFRLFRNGLGLHFERPLHEDAAPLARRMGLTIAGTNITIEHTGYVARHEALQAKARRNREIIEQALFREPNNLYWRYHLGVTLHLLGDLPGAIENLAAVVADPPPLLERDTYLYQAHEALSMAYVNTAQPERARRALERALQEFPARRHLWVRAGTVYLALDEPERAVAALEHAKALPTDSTGQAWAAGVLEEHLYQAYLLLGNLPKAQKTYLAMLSQMGKPCAPVPTPTWRKAQSLFGDERYGEVIRLLEPVAHGDPAALRMLARSHRQRQDWARAAACLAGAVALSAPQPGEWADLARYALQAGNRARHAQRYCHLALADAPGDSGAAALNLLGVIAVAQDAPAQALTYFVQALLAGPQDEAALHNLSQLAQAQGMSPAETLRQHGVYLLGQKEYASAAEAFAAAVKVAPRDIEAYKALAVALQKAGQQDDALLAWQTAQGLG